MTQQIVHVRFELLPQQHPPDLLPELGRIAEAFTPQVQLLPPDSVVLNVAGALRFWDCDAPDLARLVQLRAAALYGVRGAAATAPNRMLASMACALTEPGRLVTVGHSPAEVSAFLRPRPVRELPGIGPSTAGLLGRHGLHTVGDIADLPLLTVQRLLGASTGRTIHERAHGRDIRTVDPGPVARSTGAEHAFVHDELDPGQHRRALLSLATQLGSRLRASDQAAGGLTVTVLFADRSTLTRSRTLAEPSGHTVMLGRAAYALYNTFALQRARVRTITLRATALQPAASTSRQLALDSRDDHQVLIEAVVDRARARFGDHVLYPAALAPIPGEPTGSRLETKRPGG